MFLLIQGITEYSIGARKFTFHNVSINSQLNDNRDYIYDNLHSTMFLLIRGVFCVFLGIVFIYIPQCFY